MGVDVHILVRHNFYELDNFEKSMQFANDTIERIKRELYINEEVDHFELYGVYNEENKWAEVEFKIPLLDLWLQLRRGYWDIWTGYHYCQVTNKGLGRLHLADDAFDVARSIGQNEAWYCDEFIADEFHEDILENFLAAANKRLGITEYPYSELMQYNDDEFPDPAQFYHDSFKVIRNEFAEIHTKCGEYKPTCINLVGNKYIRVAKDGNLNLLNRGNFEPLFHGEFNNIQPFRGRTFLCKKDNKTALFSCDGQQLTEFATGEFKWEWAKGDPVNNNTRIFIYNKKASIRVLATYFKNGHINYTLLPYNSVLVKRKPIKCPICKGKIAAIVYDEPTPEVNNIAMREGGGYIVNQGNPQWRCLECETKFVRDEF